MRAAISINENPFYFNVISNIALCLSPNDLTKLRLTCKLWNRCMIPTLAKTNSVYVKLSQHNVYDFIRTISSKINQYHHTLPYTRFKCKNISFHQKLYNSLFTKIGSSLTHLVLGTSAESDAVQLTLNQFRHLIFNLAPRLVELEIRDKRKSVVDNNGDKKIGFWNQGAIFDDDFPLRTLPSLKEIEFNLVDADGVGFERFIVDFFNSAINLTSIYSDNIFFAPPQNIPLLRGMTMTEAEACSKLTWLSLNRLSNQGIELLIQLARAKSLHLVSFTILRIQNGEQDDEFQCDKLSLFLNLQSDTLVDFNLGIDNGLFQTQQYLKLHCLKVLEELALDTRLMGVIGQYTEDTTPDPLLPLQFDDESFDSFSSVFPKLNRFEYKYTVEASPFDIVSQLTLPLEVLQSTTIEPHLGVEDLEVETVCNKAQLNNLSLLFPCVTKLNLKLLPEAILTLLPLIWVKWPQLTNLELSYLAPRPNNDVENKNNDKEDKENTQFLDGAITGVLYISNATVTGILLENCPPSKYKLFNNLLMYKTGSGLSDLKHIKTLKLDLPWSISDLSCLLLWSHPSLTDVSLVKGDNISCYCLKLVGENPNFIID